MKPLLVSCKYPVFVGFMFCFISSCNNNTQSFTPKERSLVQDSVQLMVESIAKDISNEGPVIWLKYFENVPEFLMASDGQLVFPNIDTAMHLREAGRPQYENEFLLPSEADSSNCMDDIKAYDEIFSLCKR